MRRAERHIPRGRFALAAAILALKGVLGLWAAYALLRASPTAPQSFLGGTITDRNTGLGTLLLVLAVVSLLIAAALFRFRPWARFAALTLEGLAVVLALTRLGSRPGAAIVSLALSGVVIALLIRARRSTLFAG